MAAPEVRKRMGEAALARARSFPVAEHVNQMRRVYRSFWPEWVSVASLLTSLLETEKIDVERHAPVQVRQLLGTVHGIAEEQPTHYDLVFNTDVLTPEHAADLIAFAAQRGS